MSGLREYQSNAVDSVRAHWKKNRDLVCLVAPTGSGKTVMGEELVSDAGASVWIAHRRELVIQTAERLRARFGRADVGVIMPGEYATPKARIQVATVQTLLARKQRPKADTFVLDEAHHYAANEWRQIADAYPKRRCVGLTATPERQDGEPLGDVFGAMVVAAKYSELLAGGWLVPARVYAPSRPLGNDLAQDPLAAWMKMSGGERTFAFCARVDIAQALARRFRHAGVRAHCIEAKTPKRERDDILDAFKRGHVRIITNVNTMTEGIDVPEARVVMLARKFGHVGGYLQAVGRALRVASGKPDAIFIDLVGAARRHGLPTDDRAYSLKGRAIGGGEAFSGHDGAREYTFTQEVLGEEMVELGRAEARATTSDATAPQASPEEQRRAYDAMLDRARALGHRPALADIAFRQRYGEAPPRRRA